MPSKKDKKNARDGGVASAVSKLAAGKFSSGSPSKNLDTPSASSSSVASPSIQPVQPPSNDESHVGSPPLDALSVTSTAASTHPEWARHGLAGSPGNLVSLMGESPPTQPSSYEDHSRFPHNWAHQQRHMMSPQLAASPSPPNSFPNSFRRPLSYQQETNYLPEMHAQVSAAAVARRASVQSPFSQLRPGSHNPPLPHHPQAHFYGAPDIDLDLPAGTGIKAGHNGHYFGFDTLPSQHSQLTPGSDNVVVAGYQGGVEIHSITKRGLDRVAGLRGLRGAVLEAKILPWVSSGPHADAYPLIAVVIHGPVLPRATPDIAIQRVHELDAEGGLDAPSSPRPDSSHREPVTGRMSPTIEFYQTSVELYSLKTNRLIDVLLEAPKTALSTSITSPIFKPPAPTGAFKVKADGGHIVVASGTTGEAWLFRLLETGTDDGKLHAGCAGKVWTTLQQPLKVDVAEEHGRQSPAPPPRAGPPTPIIALNGRWLAHCPPTPSTQIALRAHIPVQLIGRAPGASSVTSPVLPTVNSVLDLPISEGVMNKIMRETTQELISGAKWVGQQGMQAWNAYWYKNSVAQQPRSPPLQPQQWVGSYPPRQDSPHFPPTHGTPGHAVTTKEPGLVSIIDLSTISSSVTVHPVSTFPTPLGCSFLSFSPSGLSLFTASSKGDVQTVWDLMRMQYTKSSPVQVSNTTTALGPRVRQVAHFSRMTVARIVDVAWSKPNGERVAMITERGTAHLLDMPESAFTWPPPRRRRATEANGAPASETPSTAVSIASSAVGAAFQAARPLITRPRRGSATVSPSNGGNNFVENASQGGRYIAASISQSLGKTGTAINQLRHTADNRVSLPPSPLLPSASCVVWLTGKRYHTLYVLGDGLVRTFPSKSRQPTARDKSRAQRGSRYKDLKVPLLPGETLAPAVTHFIDNDEYLDLPEHDADAGNTLTLDPRARPPQLDLSAEAAIPQAEIESSAPYQPFHTDRRVGLYEYGGAGAAAEVSAVADLLAETSLDERPAGKKKRQTQQKNPQSLPTSAARGDAAMPWAFGQKLDLVQLDLGYGTLADEDFNTSDDTRALPTSSMERVMHAGDRPDEIVVTTRRRRGRRAAEDEDGFFEDDCEILDFADQRV